MNTRILILPVALVGLALASCGGSGDTTGKSTASVPMVRAAQPAPVSRPASSGVTHEQFLTKLDTLCKKFDAEESISDRPFDKAMDAEDYDKAADLWERNEQQQTFTARLADIEAPREDRKWFYVYARESQARDGVAERVIQAIRDRDTLQILALIKIGQKHRAKKSEAAIMLGSKKCGT